MQVNGHLKHGSMVQGLDFFQLLLFDANHIIADIKENYNLLGVYSFSC